MRRRALVSVVIPCYNPTHFLRETLASVRAQSYRPIETILVNDGTDNAESLALLASLAGSVTRLIEQPNRGLGAARNAGFRAAAGACVLPLDADDRIAPRFVAECAAALEAHPEAAFVYADYRIFGDQERICELGDYNLYDLLDQNILCYASLIRRADWELAGGYDESMRMGYEDWDFWLRLGERGRFGRLLPQVLFEYRKHGPSLY
ncbi:MAG TPA: glycosyltransferase, partial [Bryobacterales bacterium]|nr:glycosyltransferase [Bryobacterales bacterium]